jgi:hypothetical protein
MPPSTSSGRLAPQRLGDARQRAGGGHSRVQRAPAVVADDDAGHLQRGGLAGVVRVQHALEQHRQPGAGLQPGHVVPGGRLVQQAVEQGALAGPQRLLVARGAGRPG